MQIHPLGVLWRRLTWGRAASSERTIAIIVCMFCGPIVLAHGCYMTREFRREMLYAVRCLKSNDDMILALAGQFKQLSHELEKFR